MTRDLFTAYDRCLEYDEKLKEFNAFRFTDFTFRKFFEAASVQDYFRNTVFVFVGDHGIPGDAGDRFPKAWTEQRLTSEHVPLLFYGPGIVEAGRRPEPCSQVDVMATVAGFAKQTVSNTGLGRNLMDHPTPFAFIFNPEARQIGIVKDSLFYRTDLKGNAPELVSVNHNGPLKITDFPKNKIDSLASLSNGIYETAAYLLLHNKKK